MNAFKSPSHLAAALVDAGFDSDTLQTLVDNATRNHAKSLPLNMETDRKEIVERLRDAEKRLTLEGDLREAQLKDLRARTHAIRIVLGDEEVTLAQMVISPDAPVSSALISAIAYAINSKTTTALNGADFCNADFSRMNELLKKSF